MASTSKVDSSVDDEAEEEEVNYMSLIFFFFGSYTLNYEYCKVFSTFIYGMIFFNLLLQFERFDDFTLASSWERYIVAAINYFIDYCLMNLI